jgi:hypothetical protein
MWDYAYEMLYNKVSVMKDPIWMVSGYIEVDYIIAFGKNGKIFWNPEHGFLR